MSMARAALVLLVAAPMAAAADRLFPTDVLEAGEADSSFTMALGKAELSFDGPPAVEVEADQTFGILELRAGLGGGLQVGGTAPYLFGGETCVHSGGMEDCEDAEADWGSAALFADWRIAGDARSPFSAALHVQYDTNSGADESEGYDLGLTGGWALGTAGRGYIGVSRNLPQADFTDESWSLEAGAFVDAGAARIVPEVFYTRFDADEDYSAYASYGAGLSAHFAVDDRITLIPAVAYNQFDFPDYQGQSPDGDASGWVVGLTLYSYFGDADRPAQRPAAKARRAPAAASTSAAPAPVAQPAPTPAAPAPQAVEPTAAPAPPAEAAPAAAAASPQVGAFTLSRTASLYPGPRADAQPMATLAAGATVTLKLRMQNTAGTWWFAESPDRKGWLREEELR